MVAPREVNPNRLRELHDEVERLTAGGTTALSLADSERLYRAALEAAGGDTRRLAFVLGSASPEFLNTLESPRAVRNA